MHDFCVRYLHCATNVVERLLKNVPRQEWEKAFSVDLLKIEWGGNVWAYWENSWDFEKLKVSFQSFYDSVGGCQGCVHWNLNLENHVCIFQKLFNHNRFRSDLKAFQNHASSQTQVSNEFPSFMFPLHNNWNQFQLHKFHHSKKNSKHDHKTLHLTPQNISFPLPGNGGKQIKGGYLLRYKSKYRKKSLAVFLWFFYELRLVHSLWMPC
jgi:hypothetical protein